MGHLQTVRKFRPVFSFKLPWKEREYWTGTGEPIGRSNVFVWCHGKVRNILRKLSSEHAQTFFTFFQAWFENHGILCLGQPVLLNCLVTYTRFAKYQRSVMIFSSWYWPLIVRLENPYLLYVVCGILEPFSSEMQEIHFMLYFSWNRKNETSNTSVAKFTDYKVPEPQLNNQHYRDLKSIKFDLTLHNRNPKLLSNSENHALLKYFRNACVVTNHKKDQDTRAN